MTIGHWLELARQKIDALDAELILLFVLRDALPKGVDRSYLFAHATVGISQANWEKLDALLERRAKGEPLAYILGYKEFYGRKFKVSPAVLIPRPETEVLIRLIKELPLPKQPRFLEVGTGSGCIAITLALEYPQSYVLASDISVRALDIARENDFWHEGRIELVSSNLLRDIEFLAEDTRRPEHFDVVVANLPYVDRQWDWLDQKTLAYEPARALYAGLRGLSLYRRLLREIAEYDELGKLELDYLVLEADPCQQTELIQCAAKYGFEHCKTDGYGLLFRKGS